MPKINEINVTEPTKKNWNLIYLNIDKKKTEYKIILDDDDLTFLFFPLLPFYQLAAREFFQ